ncbi:MAG TPA: hypothetical protein PKK45_20465 [Leptospiraceae bacterium]|nr:hypothetical protein [Leptospiraceae bacterium]
MVSRESVKLPAQDLVESLLFCIGYHPLKRWATIIAAAESFVAIFIYDSPVPFCCKPPQLGKLAVDGFLLSFLIFS